MAGGKGGGAKREILLLPNLNFQVGFLSVHPLSKILAPYVIIWKLGSGGQGSVVVFYAMCN